MKNFLCPLIALFLTACTPSDTWLRHRMPHHRNDSGRCARRGTPLTTRHAIRIQHENPGSGGPFRIPAPNRHAPHLRIVGSHRYGKFSLHPVHPRTGRGQIECTGSDPDNRQLRLLAQGPINREWTKTLREKEQRFGARFDSIIDIEDRLYRENRLYNDTYNEVIRRLNEPTDQHALPYLYKQLNHMRLTGSGYTDEGQRLHQTLQTLYEEQAVWLQEQIARRPSLASFCRLMEQIDQEQMAGRDFFALAGDLRPGIRRPLPAHPYHEQVEHARKV